MLTSTSLPSFSDPRIPPFGVVSSKILAIAPSAPAKSERELMEERLMPLRERQQRMQLEQEIGTAPLRQQQERIQIGEYLGGAGLRSQQAGLASSLASQEMGLLPLRAQQERMQIGEFISSAGLRQAEREAALARMGFERLKMQSEGRRIQSEMAFMPQMEAIRGGIMRRMAGSLGVNLPPQSIGGGYSGSYSPSSSWMQNYQVPQFPRYS